MRLSSSLNLPNKSHASQKYLVFNEVKLGQASKDHYTHAKRPQNMTHTEENNQSIETNPGLIQMLEGAEKDIKMATLTVFCMFKTGRDMAI